MLTGSGSYIDANIVQIAYQSSMTGGSGSAFKLDNGKTVLFKHMLNRCSCSNTKEYSSNSTINISFVNKITLHFNYLFRN